jgi:hypothetical protein
MLRAVVKGRKSRYLPLVALFALNPMMMQNAWYPWTKLLAVFYILFAIWLYLAGLRKNDRLRIPAAFVCLAAGLIVHYSAGPYVMFLGGHYLLRVFLKRPQKLRELATIVICSGMVLAPWFGWSMKTYGVHGTVGSNTSVTSAQRYQGSTAARIAGNVFNTIVPAILHDPESLSMFNQPNKWAELRDNAFVLYQTNLIFAMGLIGGPVALWLLYGAFRRARAGPERNFWLAFLPVIVLLGIGVVGEADLMGLAHLTLMPIEALGITLIAASFPWNRALAAVLLVGCALDFSLGIFLQEKVESLQNSPQHTYFGGLSVENNRLITGAQGPETIGGAAWLNWFWKSRDAIHKQWLEQLSHLPQGPGVMGFERNLREGMRANQRNFGGWYERHGGAVTFLGDWLSEPSAEGVNAPTILALLLFIGLMARFGKEAMRLAPVAAPQMAPPPRKKVAARRR